MKQVHTDGACRGNPGPGGWAWASGVEHYASGADAHTTNQRMEVIAVIEALRENPEDPIEIVSDSNYVVKCFNDKWYLGWRRRNWKNSQGQPSPIATCGRRSSRSRSTPTGRSPSAG